MVGKHAVDLRKWRLVSQVI